MIILWRGRGINFNDMFVACYMDYDQLKRVASVHVSSDQVRSKFSKMQWERFQ
jgi:hypothetical protein